MTLRSSLVLALAFCGAASAEWTATWATAQPMIRIAPRPPAPPPPPAAGSAAAPGAAPAMPPPPGPGRQGGDPVLRAINTTGFKDQTVRMIVHTSIGGSRLRIKLSNSFGVPAVKLGSAHVAMRGTGASDIVPASDHAITFNGKSAATIGPGVVIYSDPVDMKVANSSELAVSLYFPAETGPPASHNGLRTSYVVPGDATSTASLSAAVSAPAYYFLAGLDVMTPNPTAVIVTLGDSITEGARSTPDTNHQWPTLLADRLLANKATANFAVANVGIGGNRLLRDVTGASALARLDRDVFSQSGVKWMTLMEGINDIGRIATMPEEAVTAEELIDGYKQIIERAHAFGIRIVGCTLTPYGGANYYSETGEAVRTALNNWIRTSGAPDAVADFDLATRDAADPKKIRSEFDPGDHLHPNDAGYQAMANSIELAIFSGKRK